MNSEMRKKAAVQFMKLIEAGKIDEAYERYVDMGGKHHNVFTPASMTGLKKGMTEAHHTFPNLKISVKNVIGEGDDVVVHSSIAIEPGKEMIAFHLFRFKGDRILECWDCAQPLPDKPINTDGAF